MEAILNLFYLCILCTFCCFCKVILLNTFWRQIFSLISILILFYGYTLELCSLCYYLVNIIFLDYFNSVVCLKITGLK